MKSAGLVVISRSIIVGNAPMEPIAVQLLQTAIGGASTLVVGVDGGATRLRRLGIRPDVVTGDFDSLTSDDLAYFEEQGVAIVPTPDQDYTDLDKALTYVREAVGNVPTEVFGATGGRLDHTYSVLSALIKHGVFQGSDIALVDEIGKTQPLRDGELIIEGADLSGRTISLITLGMVNAVTLTGVRWTLDNETLAPGLRDGTLNEITENRVVVRSEPGAALLVQVHHFPLPIRRTAR